MNGKEKHKQNSGAVDLGVGLSIDHPDRTLEQFRAQINDDVKKAIEQCVVADYINIYETHDVEIAPGKVEKQQRLVGMQITLWFDEDAFKSYKAMGIPLQQT